MRMLVVFQKGEALRHIGHLDLMRAMQRILRRTGLPVAYSQGFNPHMVMNFAAPLSVGAAGKREIMDVGLLDEVGEKEFLDRLGACLPPGLRALEARLVPDGYPAPMSRLFAASYELSVDGAAEESLPGLLPGFLNQAEIPAMRKTKSGEKLCDLRPMIYDLSANTGESGIVLSATLALREQATLKPDLLMETLCAFGGIPCPAFSLMRTALWGQRPQGELIPLESL